MVKKINHKVVYSFLGILSFLIGLILMPFPSSKQGGSIGIPGNTAHADVPSPDPDGPSPDPCPDPSPDPCV